MRSPMLAHLFDLEGNFVGSWAIDDSKPPPLEIRLAISDDLKDWFEQPIDKIDVKVRRFRLTWRLFKSGLPIYEERE